MSRRYGRNQKRRAREEIARLESMVQAKRDAHLRDLGMLQGALAEKRAALAAVAEAMGPHFVGLPLNDLMLRIFDAARREELPDSFRLPARSGNDLLNMQVMNVSTHDFRLENAVHFRVQLAGGDAAYAISEAAIARMPARFLARNIADQLAEYLVRELVKRGASR